MDAHLATRATKLQRPLRLRVRLDPRDGLRLDTPGDFGCLVAAGVIVYGTGYVDTGWYGVIYCPPPARYGFAFRDNPYTGAWAVGVGDRGPHGGFYVGHGSGWWGVGGYRPVYGDVDFERTVTARRDGRYGERGTFRGTFWGTRRRSWCRARREGPRRRSA